MDITEEKKLLKEKNSTNSLQDLFRKYKIENFFWRNYKDKKRIRSFLSIIITGAITIIFTISFWKLIYG